MPIVTKTLSGVNGAWDEVLKAGGQIVQNIASGNLDVGKLMSDPIGTSIRSISFHTAYTAPVTTTGAQIMASMGQPPDPNAPIRLIGSKLRPTMTIDTIAGRYEYAPYGASTPTEWKANRARVMWMAGLGVAGVLGLTFALGRLSKSTK